MARKESILIKTENGDAFLISAKDEFNDEVELLRRNHTFLTMLDKFKSEEETIPLSEVEKALR